MAQEANKFVRVEPADPTRCQSIAQDGNQCVFQGTKLHDGGFADRCPMHFGAAKAKTMKQQAHRIYLLEKYRGRIDRLSDPDISHNLDDELGIQRMLLENMLERATPVELLTQAPQMSQLVRDIRETLLANKKIKSAYGELLDKASINKLCDQLIQIIAAEVPATRLDAISEKVAGAIALAVANRFDGGSQ